MKISNQDIENYKFVDISFPYDSNENDNIQTMEYNLLSNNIPISLFNQKRYYFIMEFLDSIKHYDSKAGNGIYNILCQGYEYTSKQKVTMYLIILKAEKIKDKLK